MEIEGGIYGKHSDDVFLPADCHVKSYDKAPYFTAVSKFAITNDDPMKMDFFTADPEMAKIIGGKSSHKIIRKSDTDYSQLIKKPIKDRYKTKAHILAFVLQYQ